MGQRAMDLLLARINGDEQPLREIKLPPRLIVHNLDTAAVA
jgi:DNA-binding LacI/PurR family transcriptional regulator